MIRQNMRHNCILLIVISLFFSVSNGAHSTEWTEKKLGKIIIKAEKAAQKKKWALAIKHGEVVLAGSKIIDRPSDPRYIAQLKNLNRYYDKRNRLSEVGPRVKEAYQLSKTHLGLSHQNTRTSRHLYYKYLLITKNYIDAIPLVAENISLTGTKRKDKFQHLHYLKQLSTLYGLTKQISKEEKTLTELLEMNKKLLGQKDKDTISIIKALAENYCRQDKIEEFEQLIQSHDLKYYCK